MAPWMIWLTAGHFLRDLLPKELLPGLPGMIPTVGAPQESMHSEESEEPHAPLGPTPLDMDISVEMELAVWDWYADPEKTSADLYGFSNALAQDGLPIAAGLIRARGLYRSEIREAQRAQQAMARVAGAPRNFASEVHRASVPAGEDEMNGSRPIQDPNGTLGPLMVGGVGAASSFPLTPEPASVIPTGGPPPAPVAAPVETKAKAIPAAPVKRPRKAKVAPAAPGYTNGAADTILPPPGDANGDSEAPEGVAAQ
jgi:hypothetical protein